MKNSKKKPTNNFVSNSTLVWATTAVRKDKITES
jgi:hypothetical protein